MIEEKVLTYLSNNLECPVLMEFPDTEQFPDITTFVVIEKTGHERTNLIDSTNIACQSYAPTLYQASVLDEKVRRLMDSFNAFDFIFSCRLQRNYNFTDTTTKRYRYQCVYTITHKEDD